MFKEQKMTSCLSKVTFVLCLMTYARTLKVMTPLDSSTQPEFNASPSFDQEVEIAGLKWTNNDVDVSTCNFAGYEEYFTFDCLVGYDIDFTERISSTDYEYHVDASQNLAVMKTCTEDLSNCIKGAQGSGDPNFEAVITACPDVVAFFGDNWVQSLSAKNKNEDEEDVAKKTQIVTFQMPICTGAARIILI